MTARSRWEVAVPDCHAPAIEVRQSSAEHALPVAPDDGLIGDYYLPGTAMRPVHTAALAIIAAVLLVHPASAQSMAIPLNQENTKSPEEIEKQRQIEADYKATLKKIPDAKANDPWGNMRSADTAAKPTPPKPKTAATRKTNNAAD